MQRVADLLGPTPYPGEQGDTWQLNHPHPKGGWTDEADVQDFKFVYIGGQLHVSDKDDYDQLANNAGSDPDHTGPMAFGKIHVDLGKASFQVHTNLHAKGIERVLQTLTQKQGWQWGGVTDFNGSPLSEPKVSSIYFEAKDETVQFAHSKAALKKVDGAMHLAGKQAYVYPFKKEWYGALKEWADDTGHILYAAYDNVIKTVEDLEEGNIYSPDWLNEEDHFLGRDPEQGNDSPQGPMTCSHCNVVFPSINSLILHRKSVDAGEWDDHENRPSAWGKDPSEGPDMDDALPARFHEQNQFVYGRGVDMNKVPKDYVDYHDNKPGRGVPIPKASAMGIIPFIYDVKHDKIVVGQPGITPDTMGADYTPGGIVRGQFDNGALSIQSTSDFPITIGHFLDLWSWTQPTLTVRSVWLDDGVKPERLAHTSIWEE